MEQRPPVNSERARDARLRNTNRWSTRQLVTMALLAAIGIVLSFIEFAIFPVAPFLKYDASIVAAMVAGFAFGAGPGMAVGFVIAAVHGLLASDPWGALMTLIVTAGFVIPAAVLYSRKRTMRGALCGLAVSFVSAVLLALAGNLVITPVYTGAPLEAIMALMVPVLLPFNLLKALLNAVLTLVVYKSISNLITPKKHQVKGR